MHDQKTSARRQFDGWSRSYDRSILQSFFFGPAHRRLLEAAGTLPHGARVLDLGCGTGLFVRRLLESRTDVQIVGLDLSDAMLEHAKNTCAEFGERARFVHADSEHLPFEAGTFEWVSCSHSFHHYPNQAAVVAEVARVLKPNGRMALIDADRDGWWGRLLFDGVVSWCEGGVQHCSARRMQALCLEAGLSDVVQERHGSLAPWLLTTAGRNAGQHSQQLRAAG